MGKQKKSPEQVQIDHITHDLKLQFAGMLNEGMRRRRVSVEELAEVSGVRKDVIDGILHAHVNADIETVANLLHPLKVNPGFATAPFVPADAIPVPLEQQ